MKALLLKEYLKFAYEEVPMPEFGPTDVLVSVKACGICGSDVHGMDGSTDRRRPPIIMGHEASGIISEVGSGVRAWKPGDRVTFDSTIYCGSCEFCQRGEVNLCNQRRVFGVSCEDYSQAGAFAEFVAVPQHMLYLLPDNLSFEQAALIEPFAIAFHAIRRKPGTLNDTAVIIGCGLIGLALLQLARLAGFGRVLAVDMVADRLARAASLGAHETINSSNGQALAEILRLIGNRGADHIFEAVGLGATVDLAVRAARKGGCVTLVGNVAAKVEVPLQVIVTRELSLFGSCASAGEYPACLDMMGRGAITAAPLLSAVAPLSEGASYFERLHKREAGLLKVILTP
jgi:threonine dehydrogenase-like Zn-dependent dehydrogenase